MTIDLQWQAQGWTVEPEVGKLVAGPGLAVEKRFLLTPLADGPARPKITVSYTFTDTYRKRRVERKREASLAIYTQMDVPNVVNITIDADLNDWSTVKALPIADKVYVAHGASDWAGPEDSSFDLQLAFDGERLFLAVDVTDEQICIDSKETWRNDGVEIFWDIRPTAERNGRHAQGTGQVILVVPEQGIQQIKPDWYMGQRTTPKGLKAICKRRDGGYVFELSIPLSELGYATAPKAGQSIRLAAMINDCDKDAGNTTLTHTTTMGLGGYSISTAAYPPWRFK